MLLDPQTIQNYRALMAELDPAGPPAAHMIHRTDHAGSTRIGVLDASFNPLTLAHEALLNAARDALRLGEMLLLLSRANVDKEVFGADLGQRLTMLVDYARSHPHVSVAGCSHARFVDKIQALRPLYPGDVAFYFIAGYDTLIRLFDPKYYTDMHAELHALFSAGHMIIANRGSSNAQTIQEFLSRPECAPFAHRIHPIAIPPVCAEISSTRARDAANRRESLTNLVPPQIAQAIDALAIYRSR